MKQKKQKFPLSQNEKRGYSIIYAMHKLRTFTICSVLFVNSMVIAPDEMKFWSLKSRSYLDLITVPIGLIFIACEIHIRKKYKLPKIPFNLVVTLGNIGIAFLIVLKEVFGK